MGDSLTVSAGVDFDLIYTSLLEKKIKQRFPHENIINLAVGGYNIFQYRLVLEEVGLSLKPDMVLVSVFPSNDFSMDTYEKNYAIASGNYHPEPTHWYEMFYVYRAYLWRLKNIQKKIWKGVSKGEEVTHSSFQYA